VSASVATDAVAFTVPTFTPAAQAAAGEVLSSGWVTTGPQCAGFEQELGAYLGAPHVVTLTSCTHALELSLRGMRLDPGAAVLTPSLTFCGAVAAIVHCGYRPVLVDIDEDTLVPSEATVAQAVRRAGPVAAMVLCDLGGYPVQHAALARVAGLPYHRVVVDAAHGPGGAVGRADPATAPWASCLSFYATKNLPIGEGGAVATHHEELAAYLRRARLHGMSKDAWKRYLPGGSWRYDVVEIGHKANMTDLQAAIGRAQLRALPQWQQRRAQIVARYDEVLAPLVRLPARHPGHAYHLYQVRVRERDAVSEQLSTAGIGNSVHFIPVHQLTGYARALGAQECAAVPVTDRVAQELLSLPLYPSLTDEAVDRVSGRLAQLVTSEQGE